MTETITIIIITTLALTVALYWRWRTKRRAVEELRVFTDVKQISPLGITFYSRSGVSPLTALSADESLDDLFDFVRANRPFYTNALRHGDYTIYVLPDCQIVSGVPCFLVRADDYDGSEYDQDPKPGVGRIFAAEKVIGYHPNAFVICESADADYIKNAVRYGAEHCILYHNDSSEYERTKFHGNGNEGHPIIK